ncbi:ferredoxin [Prauserella oleivorans]|uniref:Ferredoxin n=1 Tax=Prauserella oleivorans TaxID=1478153 RepID=A0ABW5WAQ4_9PSEU
MSRPPVPLDAAQRQQLIGQIGRALATAVPPGWRRMRVEYRAAGRHVEADLAVTGPDGVAVPARPPAEAVQLLGRLRTGMYEPGRGTWLTAVLEFSPEVPPQPTFVLDDEPRWRRVPPPIGFQDELRFFPRAEQHIPGWWRQRAGLPPAPGAGELRTPRVYDGLDAAGRPVVNRPALPPEERERVLGYLEQAPVVLAARSYDADVFDPDRAPEVPLTFRTDGTWVWPGAVAYYLREHGVAPDPELAAHIRARGFVVPDVGEPERERAIVTITSRQSTAD